MLPPQSKHRIFEYLAGATKGSRFQHPHSWVRCFNSSTYPGLRASQLTLGYNPKRPSGVKLEGPELFTFTFMWRHECTLSNNRLKQQVSAYGALPAGCCNFETFGLALFKSKKKAHQILGAVFQLDKAINNAVFIS